MNKYEEAKYVEAMLAKYIEETGERPTPEAVQAWLDAKTDEEKLALGDAMKEHKESYENLEGVLRLIDRGKEPSFFRKSTKRWAENKSPEQVANFKEILEAMIRFLDPAYDGKISAAARQVKANGEEFTRLTRAALIAMLEAL